MPAEGAGGAGANLLPAEGAGGAGANLFLDSADTPKSIGDAASPNVSRGVTIAPKTKKNDCPPVLEPVFREKKYFRFFRPLLFSPV